MTLDKAYDPKPVEQGRRDAWKKAGLFRSQPGPKRPFVVVIPPPNVTGALHMGHALNNTLQDAFVRWRRLLGDEACWVPGTDHGGIATQNVMEKQLKAEGKTRHDLGRDAFLERMQAWTRDCKKTILGQLEALGCALDWSRESFTMDEPRAKAVFAAFKALWEKGLVYRGERMVNWCVRCGTALSDIEVEHEERKGHLWHIHYTLPDNMEGLVVATTRPETLLGDTAVAVNPKDSRYSHLIGRTLSLPLLDRPIPVVADQHVDSSFGTGAVKVTPAHDPNDFEIGQRHKLPSIKVIGPDGKMTAEAGRYAGLSREEARKKVVEDLEASALLRKTEDHRHSVGTCYRCGSIVEPLLSWQWFVKQSALAKPALKALERAEFRVHPASWGKPYREWLEGIRDWCVSRQIWWGHRIPVWYCRPCNGADKAPFHQLSELKGVVSESSPAACASCGGKDFLQDPDVLDTWFSSALWPLSVFGWPEKTADLAFYYPTSVLVTGYEILYLWVARMQMMGLEFLGKVPFADAVIHGIVRDKSGKKMSKSLGNVVDPLEMMERFGTDALRFSLCAQAYPGKDIPFSPDSITGSRNFANKLWNSTRFVLMHMPDPAQAVGAPGVALSGAKAEGWELADYWIVAAFQKTLSEVYAAMARWDVAAAAESIYSFFWDKYCDWYIELAKPRLEGPDGLSKSVARSVLVSVLTNVLKLLHPFMPFITEQLFLGVRPYTGETEDFLLRARVADPVSGISYGMEPSIMEGVIEVVSALRAVRSQLNVPPALRIGLIVQPGNEAMRSLISKNEAYIKTLAKVESVSWAQNGGRPPHSATAVVRDTRLFIPLEGVIDFAKEAERLKKELAKAEDEIGKIARKVENKDFLARAPEAEVALAREQHDAARARRSQLKDTLEILKS